MTNSSPICSVRPCFGLNARFHHSPKHGVAAASISNSQTGTLITDARLVSSSTKRLNAMSRKGPKLICNDCPIVTIFSHPIGLRMPFGTPANCDARAGDVVLQLQIYFSLRTEMINTYQQENLVACSTINSIHNSDSKFLRKQVPLNHSRYNKRNLYIQTLKSNHYT